MVNTHLSSFNFFSLKNFWKFFFFFCRCWFAQKLVEYVLKYRKKLILQVQCGWNMLNLKLNFFLVVQFSPFSWLRLLEEYLRRCFLSLIEVLKIAGVISLNIGLKCIFITKVYFLVGAITRQIIIVICWWHQTIKFCVKNVIGQILHYIDKGTLCFYIFLPCIFKLY